MRRTITPQQERSTVTRDRILQATIDCLSRVGYGATTTLAVGQQAEVSRGALLYHFPTRALLVAAAVEHLFEALRQEYESSFARLAPRTDRVGAAIDLLWKTFQDARLAAVLELYVAARTDQELFAQIQPIAERHHAHVLGLARAFFPEAASTAQFSAAINLVLDTLQGMAIRRLARPNDPSLRRTLALLKEIAAAAAQEK